MWLDHPKEIQFILQDKIKEKSNHKMDEFKLAFIHKAATL